VLRGPFARKEALALGVMVASVMSQVSGRRTLSFLPIGRPCLKAATIRVTALAEATRGTGVPAQKDTSLGFVRLHSGLSPVAVAAATLTAGDDDRQAGRPLGSVGLGAQVIERLARIDVTDEFPFLVTKLSPCYDR